jgi:hypothetical protein
MPGLFLHGHSLFEDVNWASRCLPCFLGEVGFALAGLRKAADKTLMALQASTTRANVGEEDDN